MDRKLVVMVVEDHPGVRDVLEHTVESWANVDLMSCNGFMEAAKWIAAAKQIDLLICDVYLPGGMTGIDVAEIAVKTFPDISVVIISGDAQSEVAGLTKRYSYLRKPFNQQELIDHVETTYSRFKVTLRAQAKGDEVAVCTGRQ